MMVGSWHAEGAKMESTDVPAVAMTVMWVAVTTTGTAVMETAVVTERPGQEECP